MNDWCLRRKIKIHAPLAQSVEHDHGKVGVCSSNLQGSFKRPSGRFFYIFCIVYIMKTCLQCGKEIPPEKRQNKYCNNNCQHLFQFAKKLEKWLQSGIVNEDWLNPKGLLRKWLLQEQNNQCAICGIEPIWNDKPMTFVLDHIDGNSENNNRQNLRLICRNCDGQLPTFAGRNKGNGREWRRLRYRTHSERKDLIE